MPERGLASAPLSRSRHGGSNVQAEEVRALVPGAIGDNEELRVLFIREDSS
ncbi:MAG TPA: hypothetical protein VFL79_00775 [Terriglobia bacterium]|nr:hypothetical protein [Terriglobia bacterium]